MNEKLYNELLRKVDLVLESKHESRQINIENTELINFNGYQIRITKYDLEFFKNELSNINIKISQDRRMLITIADRLKFKHSKLILL